MGPWVLAVCAESRELPLRLKAEGTSDRAALWCSAVSLCAPARSEPAQFCVKALQAHGPPLSATLSHTRFPQGGERLSVRTHQAGEWTKLRVGRGVSLDPSHCYVFADTWAAPEGVQPARASGRR